MSDFRYKKVSLYTDVKRHWDSASPQPWSPGLRAFFIWAVSIISGRMSGFLSQPLPRTRSLKP